MFEILAKFFKFSGKENENKFKLSIVIGLVEALASAMKIPAIMYVLIGLMSKESMGKYIIGSIAIMGIAVAVDIICKRFSTVLQTEGGYNASAFMRIKIAEHLRYLPMGYFNSNSIGEISSVTTNTMEVLGDIAARVVMLTTQGILETTMIVLMIFIFDWRIGLISAAGVFIFFVINSIMQKAGKSDSEKKVQCDTELISQIMEYIQGISEVKSYNLLGKQAKRLNDANEACAKINTKMELLFVPYHFLQGVVTKITGAIIVIGSAAFYINGTMSAVYAIGMTISAFMLYSSLECAGNYSSLLHVVSVCVDKANAILELDTMDIDGKEIKPQNCDIKLDHISFSYDKRKIIDDVSLSIPEKTTTAIVGPSGGGKSTLCNLIARFWDVDEGKVTLGGVNVKDYSMNSLMNNFSFVFQTVYLFADTIENNIKFGRQDATHEEVIAAAKKACCHDFISQLPNGYDTVIGEGGSSLSGGQKQRISIARAIMKDAPVVILDEATANVDPENEKDLMDAIEALTKEKTIIMIAHRLKTVRHADQIVVVDKGRIVQKGTHEQLMTQDGIYKRFVDAREQAVSWKLAPCPLAQK
ncbi:ABC transporter ATP-binding protein/permease [Anthropogastromicrobium aceti]|uniref:ABC transporter ATP-binding protein n=1 Tax=Anthropogastromicrobium aceti TaxID=2981768 RepID=UPI0008213430|nr:ABC transporter ATP-binding protein [Anthropogastromicrobium aceti]MCU6785408.1 ABC transporter ATP-binding protein/permease [Anthropogastromicrobium aceti]SCJ86619.1 Putative multidrug export ATP-binding/permease protein SAV1866 [uncultured Lachnospira sp.]